MCKMQSVGLLILVCVWIITVNGLLDELEPSWSQDLSLLEAKLEAKIAEMGAKMADMDSELRQVKSELQEVRNNCSAAFVKESHPMFMAALTSDTVGCSNDNPLVFDNVLLNSGNGYDNRHGVFRAPKPGYYQFGVTASGKPNTDLYVKLVKNSVDNELGYVYHQSSNKWEMATTSVLVHLEMGDDVWCKCRGTSNTQVAGGDTYHTHFTGHFISTI